MGIVQKAGFRLTVVSYIGVLLGYVNKVLLFPNFLNTDEVGLTNIMISISIIYAQFSALGMTGVTLRFFPFFRDKEKNHHGFLSWAMVIISAGFILTTIAFIALRPLVIRKYSEHAKLLVDYYYYIIPLGLALVFFQLFDSYLRSLFKTVISSFVNEVVLRLLQTLSITLYALKIVDFGHFVMIYVGVSCSVAVFVIVYTAWLGHLFVKPTIHPKVKRFSRHMLLFGFISILGSAGNSLIANIDGLMISGLMGGQLVNGKVVSGLYYEGIYSTVFFFTTVMLIPYRSILKIASPLVAECWKKKDMKGMQKLYQQSTAVLLVLGIWVFLGIWCNFDSVFSFMPPQFASGKYVFLFLSIGRLCDMSTSLNGTITITSKKYKYDLIFTFFLIGVTIATNYLFIKVYGMGMNGAAIATSFTIVAFNMLRLLFVRYFFRMQPFVMSNLWVLLIGVTTFFLNSLLPKIGNVYSDMMVRSVLVTLVFLFPILYFKLTPEVNGFAVRYLKAVGIRIRFLE
ncbi:MAG: lipopolysaccharide biosynthesis protein [Bacteroidia bacterium]